MADYGIRECQYITQLQVTVSSAWGQSSRIIITFHSVDTLTLINPFTIYINRLSECINSGAEVLLTDSTRSLANQILHVDTALNTAPMIAEWAGKDSVELVHPLLRRWLSS